MMLQLAMCALFAQKNELKREQTPLQFNPEKDIMDYMGYLIKLRPALPTGGSFFSYGFIILENNKLVARQYKNPVPSISTGIQNKDDAYNIAKWMIDNYKKTGSWKDSLAAPEAHALKIKTQK